jgi:hypothetical protein
MVLVICPAPEAQQGGKTKYGKGGFAECIHIEASLYKSFSVTKINNIRQMKEFYKVLHRKATRGA